MKYNQLIPFSFQLGGKTIRVEYTNDLISTLGEVQYFKEKIKLSTSDSYSQQSIEQTYFHELVHDILDAMGEHDLKGNEKFVDLFATFLYQAIKSSEFNE